MRKNKKAHGERVNMKETGIIMSDDHPKLIIDLLKTQTRRTYGLEKINKNPDLWSVTPTMNPAVWGFYQGTREHPTDVIRIKCPYGQVGDRLWVRERALYWVSPILKGVEYDKPSDWWSDCVYQDDPEIPLLLEDNRTLRAAREIHEAIEGDPVLGKWEWKSSIHMPKHYSRITLEITEVRVERVQEIKSSDIEAEGVSTGYRGAWDAHFDLLRKFQSLWDSLNAKRGYGWDFNPWVWPINFKKI